MYQAKKIITLLIVFLSLSVSVFGQDDSDLHPLLEMLAMVPDTEITRQQFILYSDYEATRQVRGVPTIESYEEGLVLEDSEDAGDALHILEWRENTLRLSALPTFQNAYTYAQRMLREMGIDFFTIQRALYHSNPPFDTSVISGNFNENSIITAYEEKGYSLESSDNLNYLCPPDGCGSGDEISIVLKEPGNLFGGRLGRSQSVVVMDQLMFSSPDEDVMNTWIDVQKGIETLLIDDPVFHTLAEATIDSGTVRHAIFFTDYLSIIESSLEIEDTEIPEDIIGIPPFEAIAIADIADENLELDYGLLLLVYSSEDEAISAVDGIMSNLNNLELRSSRGRMPFSTVFEMRNLTLDRGTIYVSSNSDYYVARILLKTPLLRYGTVANMRARSLEFEIVDALPEEGLWQPVVTNFGFRTWRDAILDADLAWLKINPE